MNNTVKLITAITGLIVAVGGIIAAFGLGGGDKPTYSYQTVILDSPQAYEQFLNSHPG